VPAPPPPPTDAIDDDDFAKELAAGMEQLMRELGVPTTQTEKDEAEFKKAWEKMLVGELNGSGEGGGGGIDDETLDGIFGLKDLGGAGAGAGAGGAAKGKEKVAEDEFQKKIKQAMEKLKDSDDSAKVRNTLLSFVYIIRKSDDDCVKGGRVYVDRSAGSITLFARRSESRRRGRGRRRRDT
jgi:hypothetical protein